MKIVLFNKTTFEPLLAFGASGKMIDGYLHGSINRMLQVPVTGTLSSTKLETCHLPPLSREHTGFRVFVEFVRVDVGRWQAPFYEARLIATMETPREIVLNRQQLFEIKDALTEICGGNAQRSEDVSIID